MLLYLVLKAIVPQWYYIIILWDHRRICGPLLTETSLWGATISR